MQNETTLSSLITSVSASRNFSSFTPRSFRSDSGQTHLLFLHETQEHDQGDSTFYHTYELEDSSWTLPYNLEGVTFSYSNFMVISQSESNENDFVVYYNKDEELLTKAYNGQSHQWSDSEKMFSKLDILDYLHFQTSSDLNILRFQMHSFFCLGEGAFNVVWSFESRNTSLFSHEYEKHYLISNVFSNGTIKSQVIHFVGSDVFYGFHTLLNFVSRNAFLMLYSPSYFYCSTLLPNGSWSSWQFSGFAAGIINLYEVVRGGITLQLINNHYLLSSHKDEEANINWVLTDLTATNLSVHLIQLPHKIDPLEESMRATFKLLESNTGSPVFMTAFITNRSIELWTYNLLNNTWTLISQLDYTQTKASVYYGEPKVFNIDLLADGPNWRVFWNQQIKAGNYLHEIFTVSYHTETGNWSQVTQITDTRDFTDDYTNGIVPGFSLFILFLSLLIYVIQRRRKGPFRS
ncbi:MAG: hypothetical protein ACXADY_07770 [Candidatus Hodarchaeales archaeon]